MFYNPIEQLVLAQFGAEPPFGGSEILSKLSSTTPFLGQDQTVRLVPEPFPRSS